MSSSDSDVIATQRPAQREESDAIRFLRAFVPFVAAPNALLILLACEGGGWATIGVMAFHAPVVNACLGVGGLVWALVSRPTRSGSSRAWKATYALLVPVAAYAFDVAAIFALERLGLVERGGC